MPRPAVCDRFATARNKQGQLLIQVLEDASGNLLDPSPIYSDANPPADPEFANWSSLVQAVNDAKLLCEQYEENLVLSSCDFIENSGVVTSWDNFK